MNNIREIKTPIPFSGKKESWWIWKFRFMNWAGMREYEELFELSEGDIPFDNATEEDEQENAIMQSIKTMNKIAMLDLGRCMQSQTCSVIISATETPGYKYGNFVTAWKNLERRYEPRAQDQKRI